MFAYAACLVLWSIAAVSIDSAETAVLLSPSEGNPRNSEGDFIQLRDGRILFIYTHFSGGEGDHDQAYLAGRVSSDGGQTWTSTDRLILESEGDMNVMSVSLLRLSDGRIAMWYLRKNSVSDCIPFLRFSSDEAETWSEPVRCIPDDGYYVVNNDRVLQLPSGRLLIPTALHSQADSFTGRGKAMCYYSDDKGLTWTRSRTVLEAPADSRSGLQEPGVVTLQDGHLMMLCRTDQGYQMRSYSADNGETWSAAEPTGILSPVSPATIERLIGSDELVMIWNNHEGIDEELKGKRTPLTIAFSRDEGVSWERHTTLEDDPDGWYCYTALEQVGNHLFLAYCAGNTDIGRLSRTKIIRLDLSTLRYESPL